MEGDFGKWVEENLGFVVDVVDRILSGRDINGVSFAKYFDNPNGIYTREDLVHEGVIGLYMAKERYRPELGVKFTTFAYYWVKHRVMKAILKTVRHAGRTVSLDAEKEGVKFVETVRSEEDVEGKVEKKLLVEEARKMVSKLPEKKRRKVEKLLEEVRC